MNSKLGLHVTTGSRNGYNLTAPHARGIVSFLADAFVEAAETTYRVWRYRYDYNGQTNDDIMPGFDSLTLEQMAAQAAYWWPIMRDQAAAEEQRLGVCIDAIKATNEVGGNDQAALEKLVAYELALMTLAEADGRTLVFGNFASASPHWEIWEALCAPFVQEGWQRGHIYSRHAYFDIGDYYTHMERPFFELEHFDEPGPTILGEIGFVAFPGTSILINMLQEYDTQLALYPEIGFGAIFTYGQWNNANIQNASAELGVYLRERPFERWRPHYDQPPPPPPGGQHRAVVVKLPQTMTRQEWLDAAAVAYDYRHTMTASHDDMMTVLRGGNRESYVKASHAARDGDALALVEAAGYRWEPLFPFTPPPPPPPAAHKIDLLPYLRGDGRLYEVRNSQGGQERFQTHVLKNGRFLQTKNNRAEMLRADEAWIYRDWDTSPGNGRFYRQQVRQGVNEARWLPRKMEVHQAFTVSLFVQFFNWDCTFSAPNSGQVTNIMRLVAHYPQWVSKWGIALEDVICLEWVNGPERYWYARDFGLVQWERLHNDPHTPAWSSIAEIHAPGARPDNEVDLPACLR